MQSINNGPELNFRVMSHCEYCEVLWDEDALRWRLCWFYCYILVMLLQPYHPAAQDWLPTQAKQG